MTNITAIILAAGRGTRMKSDLPKVLHPILGKPALAYVLEAVRGAGIADIVTVAGYGSELVKDAARGTRIVIQKELLGSGDAVMTAKKALARYAGDVLVICGDTPLIRASTVEALIEKHRDSAASLTVLTAVLRDPTGYGRIERNDDGAIVKIVEEEHARLYEEVINEVNVGTYCFKAKDLFGALGKVKPEVLSRFDAETQAVAVGVFVDGMEHEAVAAALGVSRRTVARKLDRFLANARKYLARSEP